MAQWVMSLLWRFQSLEHSQRQAGQLVCAIPALLVRHKKWRQNPRPASLAQPRWAPRNNICCPLITAYALGHALTHTHKHICVHICTYIADIKYFVLLTLRVSYIPFYLIKYASMYLFIILLFYDFFQPDLSPTSLKRSQWAFEK